MNLHRRSVYNALAFKMGWLSCVLGGNAVGLPIAAVLVAIHLHWLALAGEWRRLAGFALLGLIVDGGFALAGGFATTAASSWPLPLWLWALWPLFGTLVDHSLAGLWRHRWLAMLCGAIGGPLSYYGGARLAQVELAAWLLPGEALAWAAVCGWLARRHSLRSPTTA
ncbi:DUF2878 domain-containing protein [Halomonas sp. HP20-15]|uniref:DUF2878 domain-containing protein n=1 Tax=Halomonas sp. HP20-15 TaxID=3085901 RepID=UPI002981DECC|nr:DUF2878 domain-containing protein [Halomonas sp. HP20-15]MDW5376147.1 DUF2878 domain-containing protein [Halomonas sp. HP20-15]